MDIKMQTCPNGHYYNAEIYTSCPECGAAGMGGAQPIGKTMPAAPGNPGGAYGGYVGVTEPIGNAGGYAPQPINKTAPAGNYGGGYNGGVGRTIPVEPRYNPSNVEAIGHTTPAVDLSNGQSEPVVGWLVCVEGPMRGVDFRLHDGYNYIGREEGDVHIGGDTAISRKNHAMVAFYSKRNTFHVGPSDGRNIIELNDEPILTPVEMKSHDILTVGNTKLMLVALCCDKFSWTAGNANG